MTAGNLEVTVVGSGSGVGAADLYHAVRSGAIEAVQICAGEWTQIDEVFALGSGIPFGLTAGQLDSWKAHADGLTLLRRHAEGHGLVNLPVIGNRAVMGGWFRHEIHSLADVVGRSFVASGIAANVLTRMGGRPVDVHPSRLVESLSSGEVDGVMTLDVDEEQMAAILHVAPVCHYPGWWDVGRQVDIFINRQVFDALSVERKAIVEAAASHAFSASRYQHDLEQVTAYRRLVTAGARLCRFPRDVICRAFDEAMALYSEMGTRNSEWNQIYKSCSAFASEQHVWGRFAETSFEEFMQSRSF